MVCHICEIKKMIQGFPGGSVVKNPPDDAGDTGRSHTHAAEPLSLGATTAEPTHPS